MMLPPLVFGHEFCAEILDHGPGTDGPVGDRSRSCVGAVRRRPDRPRAGRADTELPGGFAERFVLQESRLLAVPNGLDADRAAVTEPLAVGVHAVAALDLRPR